MSFILSVIIASIAAFGFFAIAVFYKKSPILSGIFLFIFVFLAFQFLFDQKLTYNRVNKEPTHIHLLVDSSLSANINKPRLDAMIRAVAPENIHYFADTVSPSPDKLNPQYTSLFDAMRTLDARIKTDKKIIVISDFNDNDSYSKAEYNEKIVPVLVNPKDTRVAIYTAIAPEYIQSDTAIKLETQVYSPDNRKANFSIRAGKSIVYQKEINLRSGLNSIIARTKIPGKGYKTLSYSLVESSHTNTHRRLAYVLPGKYRILVIAGRPSTEVAFISRFLRSLRWINADFHIITRRGETHTLKGLSDYSGIVLLDVADKQLKDTYTLTNSNRPIFYQPGLRSTHEVQDIFGLFTDEIPMNSYVEQAFTYNNAELVVKTAFSSKRVLSTPRKNWTLFLGWETWKWDFLGSYSGINLNAFENFWRNQVNTLISKQAGDLAFTRLNYIPGDNTPRGISTPGLHSIKSNKMSMQIMIQTNLMESCPLPANIDAARGINSNITFLNSITNESAWIKSIQGTTRKEVVTPIVIDFRTNIVILIIMLISLIGFWVSKDLGDIAR